MKCCTFLKFWAMSELMQWFPIFFVGHPFLWKNIFSVWELLNECNDSTCQALMETDKLICTCLHVLFSSLTCHHSVLPLWWHTPLWSFFFFYFSPVTAHTHLRKQTQCRRLWKGSRQWTVDFSLQEGQQESLPRLPSWSSCSARHPQCSFYFLLPFFPRFYHSKI